MKVVIFAPNGGVSLSTGGGVSFLLEQAEALAQLGHTVVLAGYHALPLNLLARMHRIDLRELQDRVSVTSGSGEPYHSLFKAVPFKASPYLGLILPGFLDWMTDTLERENPDIVWFHDDIPSGVVPHIESRRVFLYVHFPLMGRNQSLLPCISSSEEGFEGVNNRLLNLAGSRLVCSDPAPLCEEVWCNSTITQRVVKTLWGATARWVPPYPRPASRATGTKTHTVCAIGSLHKGKNYETLIRGFTAAHLRGWQLVILGHARSRLYARRLRRIVEARGCEESVRIMADASGDAIASALAESAIVAHAATFEPFGIAVLEGMACGAVPLAFSGECSGAWIDILDRGRYGLGFSDSSSLAERLRELSNANLPELAEVAKARAGAFSKQLLSQSLAGVA